MSEFKDEARAAALNGAALLIMDHQLWYDTKMFVEAAASSGMTKEEKHKLVADKLLIVFGDIGKTLLDVAIKLGVLYLQSKGIANVHAEA